jgi:hypothetical protein
MITPKEQGFLEEFLNRPAGLRLIEVLGLEVVESSAYRRNCEIARRVESLHDQIKMSPASPRKVEWDRKPWDAPDLSRYKDGDCPF